MPRNEWLKAFTFMTASREITAHVLTFSGRDKAYRFETIVAA